MPSEATGSVPEVKPKLCKCHGEPMYGPYKNSNARCRIKARANQIRYRRRGGDEVKRAYEQGPGYVTRRRRELLAQRGRIINQLEVLNGTQ